MRTLLGIVIASIVVYLWGFLFWGVCPLPYEAWQRAVDEPTAAAALRLHFPKNGVYFVPGRNADVAAAEKSFADGPVAFVHMLDVDGRPMMDPNIMAQGFGLNVAIIVLLAWILRNAAAGLPTYGSRLKQATLCGLFAVALVDLGDAVWWQIAWEWKLWQALYGLTASIVIGLILAAFIKAPAAPGAPEASR